MAPMRRTPARPVKIVRSTWAGWGGCDSGERRGRGLGGCPPQRGSIVLRGEGKAARGRQRWRDEHGAVRDAALLPAGPVLGLSGGRPALGGLQHGQAGGHRGRDHARRRGAAPGVHDDHDHGGGRARRGHAAHRRAVRRGQGGAGRVLPAGRGRSGRGGPVGGPDAGRLARPGRGPPGGAAASSGSRDSVSPDRARSGGPSPDELLAQTVRVEGRRVLATLVRTFGDLELAQDAVQEAAVTALRVWPRDGTPDDPRAWLTVAARRKAYDVLRREAARPAKEAAAGWPDSIPGHVPDHAPEVIEMVEPDSSVRDDMLRLVFTCCHPALSREAQVALALRTLAGLEVTAIARAFLVPEATMAKRLVRARQKIGHARIPYRVPSDAELPGRLPSVLSVVYLIATEAHAPTGGDAVARADLELEAVGLARLLTELMPAEAEVLSLLALLLF